VALYEYQAYTKAGKKVRATIDAGSIFQARELISRQGLFIISIAQTSSVTQGNIFTRLFTRGISGEQIILFTKQLSILLKSGVPLLQACELLIEQFKGKMRSLIVEVRDRLKEGVSFADALERYPKIFENLYVQLVRAGEQSGNLETILERLTNYLERRKEIRAQVIKALRQPMIQLGVALVVSVILITFVVPQLVSGLASQGKALPGPTALILGISNFLTTHYIAIGSFIIVFVVLFLYAKATTLGRYYLDTIKLKLPLISYITKISAVVQFSNTLSMLLEGGVPLDEALKIVTRVIDNSILAVAISKAREDIVKEGRIADYLEKTKMFPPIAIYLIRTGESSGQLDTMLKTVGTNYEKELGENIDRLTGFLGPVMMILMAVIVGTIVVAVMLPMLEMGNAV
jgi:type II secretory pathway component PulF